MPQTQLLYGRLSDVLRSFAFYLGKYAYFTTKGDSLSKTKNPVSKASPYKIVILNCYVMAF